MNYQNWDFCIEDGDVVRTKEPLERLSSFTGPDKYRVARFFLLSKSSDIETDGKMIANKRQRSTYPYAHYYYTMNNTRESAFVDEIPEDLRDRFYDVIAASIEGESYRDCMYAYVIDKDGRVRELNV